jgi:hypothetical protein
LTHFTGDASLIKLEESGHVKVDPRLVPYEKYAAELAKVD